MRRMRQEVTTYTREALLAELAALDELRRAVMPKAIKNDPASVANAIGISESRRRLLGLDAPAKVAPTSPDGEAPYDPLQAVQELDVLLAQMATRHDPRPDL